MKTMETVIRGVQIKEYLLLLHINFPLSSSRNCPHIEYTNSKF